MIGLDSELRTSLAPLKGRPYLVFHDAYQYFERAYGLASAGAVTVAPDRPVGPRRVSELRDAIRTRGIVCVFREPQFAPALVQTLVEGSPRAGRRPRPSRRGAEAGPASLSDAAEKPRGIAGLLPGQKPLAPAKRRG